jgi:Tfp pilus assembly protein PilN
MEVHGDEHMTIAYPWSAPERPARKIIYPVVDGRLCSEQLKLFMAADNRALRFYDARTGQVLRTLIEETQARIAEQTRAKQEASARQAAEQRAAEAEAEIVRLRAQLQAMNPPAESNK